MTIAATVQQLREWEWTLVGIMYNRITAFDINKLVINNYEIPICLNLKMINAYDMDVIIIFL